MAANLFGERFYGHREPAWHASGYVSQEPLSAGAAFEKMGPYDVEKRPLQLADGSGLVTDYYAIYRHPTPDDPQPRIFGNVGKEYYHISPRELCDVYDKTISLPAETIVVLGYGETIAISCKLDSFSVRKDDVDTYMLTVNPMTGVASASIRVTPTRCVCQNTLVLSASTATEQYRLVHDKDVLLRMQTWMTGIVGRAKLKQRLIKEEFDVFASVRINDEQANKILRRAYPTPPEPVPDAPEQIMKERWESWEYRSKRMIELRNATMDLYSGAGTGLDHPACKGTAWGLLNAVAEAADWRRGHGDRSIGASAIFGTRAAEKQRAYQAIHDLAAGI